MSRSRQDIIDTEAMLSRLSELLCVHNTSGSPNHIVRTNARTDAESLRRISMTLRRWHELECGSDAGAIERDEKTDKPYWIAQTDLRSSGYKPYPVADREAGARKRLALIMSHYPFLTAYVQGDPRGCALYILTKADVPEGATVDSCYSRGLAVYR